MLKHRDPKSEPPPDSFPIGEPPGKRDGSKPYEPKHAPKPTKK